MAKRMKKLKTACRDLFPPKVWSDNQASVGIIGCGSTFGPINEAVATLNENGIKAKQLQIRTLWPFFSEDVLRFIESCQRVFVAENNFSGQLKDLIKSQTNTQKEIESIVKYSGQSFRPVEISSPIQRACG